MCVSITLPITYRTTRRSRFIFLISLVLFITIHMIVSMFNCWRIWHEYIGYSSFSYIGVIFVL